MPIIKSAIKRVRVEARRQKRNLVTKNRYKELIKEFTNLVEGGKTAEAVKLFPIVQKALDMAAKKNLLHKNNASRKKSNLAKMIAKAPAASTSAKATADKKAEAKPVAKKPAAKKAPAKKES